MQGCTRSSARNDKKEMFLHVAKSAVTYVSSEKALQPLVLQHSAAHPALDAVASGSVAGLTPKVFDSPSRIIPGGSMEYLHGVLGGGGGGVTVTTHPPPWLAAALATGSGLPVSVGKSMLYSLAIGASARARPSVLMVRLKLFQGGMNGLGSVKSKLTTWTDTMGPWPCNQAFSEACSLNPEAETEGAGSLLLAIPAAIRGHRSSPEPGLILSTVKCPAPG